MALIPPTDRLVAVRAATRSGAPSHRSQIAAASSVRPLPESASPPPRVRPSRSGDRTASRSVGRQLDPARSRAASSLILDRAQFADIAGLSYQLPTGQYQRDLYRALGYPPTIEFRMYRARYERGDIATRIVNAYPDATWAHGAYIAESKEPSVSDFELRVNALFDQLNLWEELNRVDILAGIGRYAVLLLGAPGKLDSPLPKLSPFDPTKQDPDSPPAPIAYVAAFDESVATVAAVVEDPKDPRFGLPLYYLISVTTLSKGAPSKLSEKVHWTRVLHVAHELLDSKIYGTPVLRSVWNRLNDLEKIIGGGCEAAWKRMDPGTQIDIDPEAEMTPEEENDLADELDEMQHGVRRWVRTRGAKITPLAMPVATFGPNAKVVIQLISGAKAIPQRLLIGSERGELASTQDRDNWADRVMERRAREALPLVRQLISRLVKHGALPSPAKGNIPFVIWPRMEELTETDKAGIISKLAAANYAQSQAGAGIIVSSDEMRSDVYGKDPAPKLADVAPASAATSADTAGAAGTSGAATPPASSSKTDAPTTAPMPPPSSSSSSSPPSSSTG